MHNPLSSGQLAFLDAAFRIGAEDASDAMAKWLQVPSLITIESVEQQPVSSATALLNTNDDVVCFCAMTMTGQLAGHLILSFDDASGLSLADLLLGNETGTAKNWGEVETSAALESHNIIGCAYLNTLSKHLPKSDGKNLELIPSPPEFRRDFAEALLQSVFMNQAQSADVIFLARAGFELRGAPLQWTLLFVPDAPSMEFLRKLLPKDQA